MGGSRDAEVQVQSGLLLADAAALAEMAGEFWHEREGILTDAGGRHPEVGSDVWAQWVHVTTRRNATVRGSRTLALAAVEALVNDLLAAQHPEEYKAWEEEQRRGFRSKLVGLLDLHDENPDDVSWFNALELHTQLRHALAVPGAGDRNRQQPQTPIRRDTVAATRVQTRKPTRGNAPLTGNRYSGMPFPRTF